MSHPEECNPAAKKKQKPMTRTSWIARRPACSRTVADVSSTPSDPLPVTEQENPRTADISTRSTRDVLRLINDEDARVAEAVARELPQIARAVDGIVARLERGGRLFYVGTGTSGRLGVLDASECPPTFGVSADLVQGVMAGGYEACHRAVEASEDDREAGGRDLAARGVTGGDAVVGIAASGRTPYTIGAVAHARALGAFTAAIDLRGGLADYRRSRSGDRAGRGTRGAGRIDAHEGRDGAEAGAQHALDGGDDPSRVRDGQPDDEPARAQQQAASPDRCAFSPPRPAPTKPRPSKCSGTPPATCRRRS